MEQRNQIALNRSNRRVHHSKCDPSILLWLIVISTLLIVFQVWEDSKFNFESNDNCHTSIFRMLTSYGISLMIAGVSCFTACCAGQFGCLSLQAAILDIFIVYPLNFTIWVLYRVLTPFRYFLRHFLTWFVVPFVSIFHMHPSFCASTLDKFVLAVPFAFKAFGMSNIYDVSETQVRKEMRSLVSKLIPRLNVPDVILTNTLFRLLLGYCLLPLAWWLCDEMYCLPMTTDKLPALETEEESINEGVEPLLQSVKDITTNEKKELDVTFVFPKCRFLVEARKTYGDRIQGNKVCRRVCRILVEELTGKLIGHQFKVEPNLKTLSCTFSLSTDPFSPPSTSCCSSKELDW